MRYCLIAFMMITSLGISAQGTGYLEKVDQSKPSYVSPYYFGPNAFPVPDMLDGTLHDKLYIELDGDYFHGNRGDNTFDMMLKVAVPLFTPRVNLSAWMPVFEHYSNTEENMTVSRVAPENRDEARKGTLSGDIYVSADIQALLEKKYVPAVAVRACIKTASGYGYHLARYYDSPGYFFDAAVGKSFTISKMGFFNTIRVSASCGFLCWQTDNGRQNDAVMYGFQTAVKGKHLELKAAFGGYSGWEHKNAGCEDAHDSPMTLKIQADVPIKAFHILAKYQKGLQDYPYSQYSLGVAYDIDILKHLKKKSKE